VKPNTVLRGALNEINWNVDLPVKVHVEFEPFVEGVWSA